MKQINKEVLYEFYMANMAFEVEFELFMSNIKSE